MCIRDISLSVAAILALGAPSDSAEAQETSPRAPEAPSVEGAESEAPSVEGAESEAPSVEGAELAGDPAAVAEESQIERVVRPDLFEAYRPNYFLFGGAEDQVMFQFSFRYNLWPSDSRIQVFAAYTQRAWWRLYDFEESSPFTELNYNPEFFVRIRYRTPLLMDGFDQLMIGYAHESNGEDEDRSRGWDRIYVEQRFVHFFGPVSLDSPALRIYLRLWVIVHKDEVTPDFDDSGGPGQLIVDFTSGVTPAGTFEVELLAGKGGYNLELDRWRLQTGLRWTPPWADWVKFTPGLYLQGYFGYLQSLERDNIRDDAVRVGVFFAG